MESLLKVLNTIRQNCNFENLCEIQGVPLSFIENHEQTSYTLYNINNFFVKCYRIQEDLVFITRDMICPTEACYMLCDATAFDRIKEYYKQSLTSNLILNQEQQEVFHTIEDVIKKRINTYGFLLVGPPGNGKSSFCKSLESLIVDHQNLSFNHVTSYRIHVQRGINIFDDFDLTEKTSYYKELLKATDGANQKDKDTRIFVFCSNDEPVKNALFRKGRIDKIVKFDNPTQEQITEFLSTSPLNGSDPILFKDFSWSDMDFCVREKILCPEDSTELIVKRTRQGFCKTKPSKIGFTK